MSKIVITGNMPLVGGTMSYFGLDDADEIKLKFDNRPYVFDVSPGKHFIALNTTSTFRRNLKNSSSNDALSLMTSIIESTTEASWEGTVTLPDSDDVLFVYCMSKYKSEYRLDLVKEHEIPNLLEKYDSDANAPVKKKKPWFLIIVAILIIVACLVPKLLEYFDRKEVKNDSFSYESGVTTQDSQNDKANIYSAPSDKETTDNQPDDLSPNVNQTDGNATMQSENAEYCEKYYVTTEAGLRLRAGPSTDTEIVDEMPFNSEVYVYSIENNWARVSYNGKNGYCAAEYLTKSDNNSGVNLSYDYFALTLPEYWRTNYVAVENQTGMGGKYSVSFYEKSLYLSSANGEAKQGYLFTVFVDAEKEKYNNIIGEVTDTGTYYICIRQPIVNQSYSDIYMSMYSDTVTVLKTINSSKYNALLYDFTEIIPE